MIGSCSGTQCGIESTSVNTASTTRYIAQMFDLKLSCHPPLFYRTLVYSYAFPLRSCCLIAATSADMRTGGLLSQQLVDERDRNRSFADRRCDAFDIARANIPRSENTGQTGFQ